MVLGHPGAGWLSDGGNYWSRKTRKVGHLVQKEDLEVVVGKKCNGGGGGGYSGGNSGENMVVVAEAPTMPARIR